MTRTCRLSCLVLALSVSVAGPAFADSYLVYTDGGIPPGSNVFTWCDSPPCEVSEPVVCNNPEGGASFRVITDVWGGWGVFLAQPEDLSAYDGGELSFFVRAPTAGSVKVGFGCAPPGAEVDWPNLSYGTTVAALGWDGTTAWQELAMPLVDASLTCTEQVPPLAPVPCDPPRPLDLACLETVKVPFSTTLENLPSTNGFLVDRVRWHAPNTHTGASSVQVQGRQLLVDGEPFVVNGVAYAPISIGDNWQGAWRDRPDRYLVDFPLIAASGANAVRLYAPLLSTAMLDAAWAEGLYVIPTFGVSPDQLVCTEGKEFMRDQFVGEVLEWKDHPAILFWLVGNETNTNLGAADLCLDWYPQLDSMALAAHNAEGGSFHPVGTATEEIGDICVGGCSDDLTLPNVDFWGTQLYRGCSFGTAFNEYFGKANCDRPLIVTEFGADAYDSMLGAEDQAMQAGCLDTLLTDATGALAVRTTSGVSSGQVLFEWCDEWWKADEFCGTGWGVQDGCTSYSNFGYPDPGINEEWWGVVSQTDSDPDARGLRTAYTTLADSWWQLGTVLNLEVVSHDSVSGNTSLSFDPAVGADDHTLYYGPLSSVSSYGYSTSVPALGASGSSSITLPAGSLFWVVVGRTDGAEGCYGNDTACNERPPSSAASVPQTANRTCPQCP